MPVYCRALHDGVPAGPEYVIAPHPLAAGDSELLDLKERGARDKGWATERDGARLHCWKEYPANAGVAGEPVRVDRFFEIRAG